MEENQSLFDALGGEAAIDLAVDNFYEKVFSDPELVPFFSNTDKTRQRAMQKAFLTAAFGGPNKFSGRNMREAHKKAVSEGLNDNHFDCVAGHLNTTLEELNVAPELISQVITIANSVRDDVLNR